MHLTNVSHVKPCINQMSVVMAGRKISKQQALVQAVAAQQGLTLETEVLTRGGEAYTVTMNVIDSEWEKEAAAIKAQFPNATLKPRYVRKAITRMSKKRTSGYVFRFRNSEGELIHTRVVKYYQPAQWRQLQVTVNQMDQELTLIQK